MDQPVALVTGAGRGIGRATAIELSGAGYRLVLVARTVDQLHETIDLLGSEAARDSALIAVADVSRPEEVNGAVEAGLRQFGRLDAVVHCAGLAPVLAIAETSDEQWRAVIDTNLSAAFYLCRAAWPIFQRQRAGVVVNVSSAVVRDPFAGFAAYGAAKAGINLLGLSAAREGEAFGVRVHTIAPSAVETAMFRQILTPEQYPTEKALAPADVAKVIVQCVRGDLRYASGEVIYLHKTM